MVLIRLKRSPPHHDYIREDPLRTYLLFIPKLTRLTLYKKISHFEEGGMFCCLVSVL